MDIHSNSGVSSYNVVAQQMIDLLIILVILSMPVSKASSEVNILYIHCVEQKRTQVQDNLSKCVFISFLDYASLFLHQMTMTRTTYVK